MIEKIDPQIILMVDDDPDDFYLMNEAMTESGLDGKLYQLLDGVELLDYLFFKGKYSDIEKAPRPKLILLDLNMPRMDGNEVLKKLKSIDTLKDIPVIIFTTSGEITNIQQCYKNGADEYIVKPSDFEGLLRVANSIKRFWI